MDAETPTPGATDPAPRTDESAWSGPATLVRPFVEAAAVGLAIGLLDTRYSGEFRWVDPAYFLAAVALGLRHAGRSWPCWPALGASLYVAHVAAIAGGVRPPFVERDLAYARETLKIAPVVGVSVALGAIVRRIVAAAGYFRRPAGPPIRLLPRRIPGILGLVAVVAVAIGFFRWLYVDSGTVYAPGYRESAFRSLRVGMAEAEVESTMGPPLRKIAWGAGKPVHWKYTDQETPLSNFHRRWIFVRDGRVESILGDYWID